MLELHSYKMELLFNPNYNDIFAIHNADNISFYQIFGLIDNTNEIEANNYFTKDAEVKCMEWHPAPEHSNIIVFGQANGRIVLNWTSFDMQSNNNMAGREFVVNKESKHSRQCNSLSWNKLNPTLLAVGLDKHRSGSLIIWNVLSATDTQSVLMDGKITSTVTKPTAEFLPGESVNSLAWVGQNGSSATTIAVGFGRKMLRIYDIRSNSNYITNKMKNTKSTSGLCVDPLSENRIASFGEETITIWDIRNLTKPFISISTPYDVEKIQWCPTRRGMLACLLNNPSQYPIESSSVMRVYDLIDAKYSENDMESYDYYPLLRSFPKESSIGENVSGFAWDPVTSNCILTSNGNLQFYMNIIPETTSIGSYTDENLIYARGKEILLYNNDKFGRNQNKDLMSINNSKITKERAKNKYGMHKENPINNIKLCLETNNKPLYSMWEWLDTIKHLSFSSNSIINQTLQLPVNSPPSPVSLFSNKTNTLVNTIKQQHNLTYNQYCSGAREILKGYHESSQKNSLAWRGVSDISNVVYSNSKREMVLSMCNWSNTYTSSPIERYASNGIGERIVKQIYENGEIERSVAIAIWHLNLELAIQMINDFIASGDCNADKLPSVAMALSGYSGSKTLPLWISTCKTLQSSLQNSYLQMTFLFLIQNCETRQQDLIEDYRNILFNKDILLKDRICFACLHLPDSALQKFLNELAIEVVKNGSLDGVLVTGLLSNDSIQLLQNYINKTSDLQTPLLAVSYSNDPGVKKNEQVNFWRESYRELLDKHKLFFERVEFDLFWLSMFNSKRRDGEVYFHCNYCNKAVSSTIAVIPGRGRSFMGGAMQNPIMSCPSCRKPLPRCTVCSLHLGARPDDAEFWDWTSWCLNCRHGGHQNHLSEWFKSHKLCPVSDCSCACDSFQ